MRQTPRQVLTINDLAMVLELTPRKVRENEKSLGLVEARIRINGRVIRYKRAVVERLPVFAGLILPN
jgi:hypothetical protein